MTILPCCVQLTTATSPRELQQHYSAITVAIRDDRSTVLCRAAFDSIHQCPHRKLGLFLKLSNVMHAVARLSWTTRRVATDKTGTQSEDFGYSTTCTLFHRKPSRLRKGLFSLLFDASVNLTRETRHIDLLLAKPQQIQSMRVSVTMIWPLFRARVRTSFTFGRTCQSNGAASPT